MVEQSGGTVEKWNIDGGTVEQSWWDSLVEQWNIDGGIVEQ